MQELVPADHSSSASVSSLCKLLHWHQQQVWQQVSVHVLCPTVGPEPYWLWNLMPEKQAASSHVEGVCASMDLWAGVVRT